MTFSMIARQLPLVLFAALALASCRKNSEPLPELGAVPSFALVDQDAEPVSAQSMRGSIWVAGFLFTRCPTVCPQMMRAMQALQEDAQARGVPLQLVAFSVDPAHDTPEVLTQFAAEYDADTESWSFLTGDEDVIERTADAFKIAVEGRADASAEHFGILHGSHLVLIDQALRMRGYYRVREKAERDRLLTDAERLSR